MTDTKTTALEKGKTYMQSATAPVFTRGNKKAAKAYTMLLNLNVSTFTFLKATAQPRGKNTPTARAHFNKRFRAMLPNVKALAAVAKTRRIERLKAQRASGRFHKGLVDSIVSDKGRSGKEANKFMTLLVKSLTQIQAIFMDSNKNKAEKETGVKKVIQDYKREMDLILITYAEPESELLFETHFSPKGRRKVSSSFAVFTVAYLGSLFTSLLIAPAIIATLASGPAGWAVAAVCVGFALLAVAAATIAYYVAPGLKEMQQEHSIYEAKTAGLGLLKRGLYAVKNSQGTELQNLNVTSTSTSASGSSLASSSSSSSSPREEATKPAESADTRPRAMSV